MFIYHKLHLYISEAACLFARSCRNFVWVCKKWRLICQKLYVTLSKVSFWLVRSSMWICQKPQVESGQLESRIMRHWIWICLKKHEFFKSCMLIWHKHFVNLSKAEYVFIRSCTWVQMGAASCGFVRSVIWI